LRQIARKDLDVRPAICITNTLGNDAVQRGIGNKFEPAPSEEPAEHIIIVATLIAQLLRGTPGLHDSASRVFFPFEIHRRNDNHSVCAPTTFLFLSTLNARQPPTKTAKATIEMIIVASALTSGLTPRRTFEKITIGRVVEPGPETKLEMTRSSTDRVKARSQPDTSAGDITGRVTSVKT